MIRVISSFAEGPVNFHSTGPAEDQIQKLISSTELYHARVANDVCFPNFFDLFTILFSVTTGNIAAHIPLTFVHTKPERFEPAYLYPESC